MYQILSYFWDCFCKIQWIIVIDLEIASMNLNEKNRKSINNPQFIYNELNNFKSEQITHRIKYTFNKKPTEQSTRR